MTAHLVTTRKVDLFVGHASPAPFTIQALELGGALKCLPGASDNFFLYIGVFAQSGMHALLFVLRCFLER